MSGNGSGGRHARTSEPSHDRSGEVVAAALKELVNARPLLETLIHGAVAVFPLALGLVAALGAFATLGPSRWRFAGAIVLTGAILMYVVRHEASQQHAKQRSFFVKAVFCALLAMSVRSLAQAFLNTDLISDFERVHTNAAQFMRGPTKNLYAARYPYWGFLAVVLSYVYRVFGKGRLIYESFNLVCAGITALALCYAGRKLTRQPAAGLIAGLVFAVWPVLIAYSSLLTPEHPFVMLFPCACLTFLRATESRAPRTKLGWLAVTGCLVGLMESFKPIGIALLFAFLVVLVIYADRSETPTFSTRLRLLGRIAAGPRRRLTLWTGALMLVLAGGFEGTKELGYLLVEHNAGYPVNRYGLGETLRVGLDPEGMGRYIRPVQDRVEQVEEQYGSDFQTAGQVLTAEALQLITESWSRMPAMLRYKFDYLWSSEGQTLWWSTRSPRDNHRTAYISLPLRRYMLPWCDAYWILVLVLACSGAVFCAVQRSGPGMLSVGLFIAGAASTLLFTEVQQRYRSMLAPALALFAGYGAIGVYRCLSWSHENLGRILGTLPTRLERYANGWRIGASRHLQLDVATPARRQRGREKRTKRT